MFTVDSDQTVAGHGNTAIAVDSTGRIHATYVSNEELRYARFNTVSWITQTIDPGTRVLQHAITVDKLGNPHVAYLALYPSATTGELRYATLSNTHWLTTTADPNPLLGGTNSCAVSIAVDDNLRPHISYGAIPSLYYAVQSGTSWLSQTVDDGVYGYMCSSLAVESNGMPHVAYYDMGLDYNGELKYAVLSATTWISQVVDAGSGMSNIDFGKPSALHLDENQQPHMLYYGGDSLRLKYAVLSSTLWLSETLPSTQAVDSNFRGSMALDAAGRPHVSFAGQYGQDLVYATLSNTQWLSNTIDSSLGAGLANAIALSDTEHIAIIYLNTYLQQVKVAQTWYEAKQVFLPLTRQ